MKSYWRIFFICSAWFLLLPVFASAQVIVNEIAWMGTLNDHNDEWIELYNSGSTSVDLNGWLIEAADGTPSIDLEGSISAGSYFLLERTNDESVPDKPADLIYTGALENGGEVLRLKDDSGLEVHNVDGGEGWPAGDNNTKDTMQWNGSAWITAAPTPKAENSGVGDGGGDGDGDSQDGGGGGSSQTETNQQEEPEVEPQITIQIIADSIAVAGVATEFESKVLGYSGEELTSGKFFWNFGDLNTKEDNKSQKFKHTYLYPGDYVVILDYYRNAYAREPDATDRKSIKVIPAEISISSVEREAVSGEDGQGILIELSNDSTYEMDLSNWSLRSDSKSFSIPKNTIILSGKKLALSSGVTGFTETDESSLRLLYPGGESAFVYIPPLVVSESSEDIIEEMEGQEGSSAETETEAGIEELSYAPELSPKLAQEEQSSVEADSTESERIVAVLSPEGTADSSFLQEESESALAKALSVQAGAAAAALPASKGKNSSGRRGFGLLLAAVVIVSAAAALYIRKTAPKDGAEVKNFLHQPANKTQKSFADDFEFIE